MANLTNSYIGNYEANQTSRIYDISRDVMVLSEFKPIFLNLAMGNMKPTHDERFQWDEVDYSSVITQVNHTGGYNTTDTSFVVDDSTIFTDKDCIRVLRTGEVFQITNVTYGTHTLTVVRGLGNSGTGVTINDNDYLLNIGPAYEQASTLPDSNMADTTTEYNYVQTFRRAFSLAGINYRTMATPGMGYADISARKADEFMRDVEYAFIFGKRDRDTSTFAKYRTTTNGALNIIDSVNVYTVGGTLSRENWEAFLAEKAFYKGAPQKVFICGANYMKCLTKWGYEWYRSDMQVGASAGINVAEYIAPGGQSLLIYEHELFKGNTILAGLGLVIDANELSVRYTENPMQGATIPKEIYPNGKIQYSTIVTPGTDGAVGEYFCEMGLEMRNGMKHALIETVTGPAT